jgi:hypothetical protein
MYLTTCQVNQQKEYQLLSGRLVMTRRTPKLSVEAKKQLSICCETLMDKDVVMLYIEQLESDLKHAKQVNAVLMMQIGEQ